MSKLQDRRKACGLTQRELSERSGVNQRMIQNYEQGVRDINGVAGITLYKLSAALGCQIEDLLEMKNE